MEHEVSLDALGAEWLEALSLDTVIVAGLVSVDVAKQLDGLQLHSHV